MEIEAFITAVGSQLIAIGEIIPVYAEFKRSKQKDESEAAGSMRKAFNHTRNFLKKPNFEDSEKLMQISDLWNDASIKVSAVNKHLGRLLGDKSRFWADRELFIRLGRDKDVIDLNQVNDEIERMYIKM